jgi:hypothetical protein
MVHPSILVHWIQNPRVLLFPLVLLWVHITDSGALEHILSIVLIDSLPTADSITIRFYKAGVSDASDFTLMEPSAYGSITFTITSSEDADHKLNIV